MPRNYPYPFTPSTLKIGEHTLSYIDQGRGRVVVMVHGNPTWSFYYRNLAEFLNTSFRVIVPDHIGCGYSSKPQDYPYRLKDHIYNLEYLIDSLGVDRVSLVMHDWGGAIGMGFAGRRPEMIESLVVFNTAAFCSNKIPWRIKICRTPILGPLMIRGANVFARAATRMAVNRPLSSEVAEGYLAPYDSWQNRIATLRFVQDIPLSEKDRSWETLKEVEAGLDLFTKTPMLILWGGKDFCFNDHFYNEWRRRFPNARAVYFQEAGHYVLEDAFDEIGPMVLDFFSELT